MKKNFEDIFIRFDVIHERDGQTDGQTLRDSKDRACIASRGKNYDNMLSRFHPIPERHGQTDGQTDSFAISISRVSVLTRNKNR